MKKIETIANNLSKAIGELQEVIDEKTKELIEALEFASIIRQDNEKDKPLSYQTADEIIAYLRVNILGETQAEVTTTTYGNTTDGINVIDDTVYTTNKD